jgi:aerobic carbon-monoxide dehydrogenase medium subunit
LVFVEQRTTGRRSEYFHAPRTLEEASALLAEHAGQVRVAAGSTYLMLMASHGEVLPPHLVSLHLVPGLDVEEDGRLGSGVTLRRLERGPATGARRALTMAASATAGPSVRTLGTLGGNLGFPDGDLIPAALALDATVHLDDGSASPVLDYVTARPVDRISTALTFDRRAEDGWTGATVKLAYRGMDWPVVTVSTALQVGDDGEILDATTAAQALAPEPTLLPAVDAVLVGSHGEPEALDYAAQAAVERIEISADQEATPAYRKRVAPSVVRQALRLALEAGPHGEIDNAEARR